MNHSLILVYREGKFVSVKWEFVRVGEMVKVLRNSNLPADLMFVWSANDGGVCHVETMNLDGETNLKIKESLGLADTVSDYDLASGVCERAWRCEGPEGAERGGCRWEGRGA